MPSKLHSIRRSRMRHASVEFRILTHSLNSGSPNHFLKRLKRTVHSPFSKISTRLHTTNMETSSKTKFQPALPAQKPITYDIVIPESVVDIPALESSLHTRVSGE